MAGLVTSMEQNLFVTGIIIISAQVSPFNYLKYDEGETLTYRFAN